MDTAIDDQLMNQKKAVLDEIVVKGEKDIWKVLLTSIGQDNNWQTG